jgi:hypothetical protein
MDYTYKILRSSIQFNVMEVEFSAPDCESVIVGMPLPVEGQNYLDIIRSYAPIHHWARAKQVVIDVPVGEVGTLTATSPSVTSQDSTPPELTIEQLTQMLAPPPVL